MIDPRHIWNVVYNARSNKCHQLLRLSCKMTPTLGPRHIWNVTYNARRNMCHPPTSPNTAPARQNDSHAWLSSHMKRHLHIYNERSNKCHPPTSPNTAPATQNDSNAWSSSHMKRHLQCADGVTGATLQSHQILCLMRKMHKNATAKFQRKFPINRWDVIYSAGTIRKWSEHDPTMKPSVRNPPRNRGYFSRSPRALISPTTFRTPAIIQNFTKCCPCHEKWHSNLTKYCACHDKWRTWLFYYFTISMTCWFDYFTILLRDSSIAWRLYYLTIPLLDDF